MTVTDIDEIARQALTGSEEARQYAVTILRNLAATLMREQQPFERWRINPSLPSVVVDEDDVPVCELYGGVDREKELRNQRLILNASLYHRAVERIRESFKVQPPVVVAPIRAEVVPSLLPGGVTYLEPRTVIRFAEDSVALPSERVLDLLALHSATDLK